MAKQKEAYWFKHDSNAKYDDKILEMRSDYGYEGYGIYWAIIETLRDSSDFKLNLSSKKSLSLSLAIEEEKLEKFIKDCIDKYKLFEIKADKFFSNRLLTQMKSRVQLQSKMSANAKQKHLKDSAIATIRRKREEEKEKEKENKRCLVFSEAFFDKFEEWIKYRFEIKKPLTETMIEGQLKMLSKQSNPILIIEKSIMNGWQGLFEDKNNIPKTADQPKTSVFSYDEMFGMPGGTT